MAYKGRRIRKKPFYKKPVFWLGTGTAALILVLILWVCVTLLTGEPLIRRPDPTTEPTSMTRPEELEETKETLPPPPANPYEPIDFDVNEETGEVFLVEGGGVKGIDVSEWQGKIDWEKVRDSGVEFVIIRVGARATETGELIADERAQSYYKGAKAAGLKIGAYFFSQSVNAEEVLEEAQFLLDAVRDWDVEMPLVYDWEYVDIYARTSRVDGRELTDMSKLFCQTIEDAGYEPMIYFGHSQSLDMLYLEELVEYPFWLAMYSTIMDYPYKVDMWQYTETGSVPGIDGNVDMNIWFTYEE